MNWVGSAPPSASDIAGRTVVAQGQVHLRTILEAGSEITGFRSLDDDGIEPGLFLSESPGVSCMLQAGYRVLRLATEEEQLTLSVFCTWGYLSIQRRAEALAKSAS